MVKVENPLRLDPWQEAVDIHWKTTPEGEIKYFEFITYMRHYPRMEPTLYGDWDGVGGTPLPYGYNFITGFYPESPLIEFTSISTSTPCAIINVYKVDGTPADPSTISQTLVSGTVSNVPGTIATGGNLLSEDIFFTNPFSLAPQGGGYSISWVDPASPVVDLPAPLAAANWYSDTPTLEVYGVEPSGGPDQYDFPGTGPFPITALLAPYDSAPVQGTLIIPVLVSYNSIPLQVVGYQVFGDEGSGFRILTLAKVIGDPI